MRKLAIQKQQDPIDVPKRRQHSEALKEYKKLCQQKKAIFEQSQIAKLEELANDPSEFWMKWKYYGDSFNNNSPKKVNGKKWEVYFRRLYQNNNNNTMLPNLDQNIEINGYLNSRFTLEELDHVIDKLLKYGKAAGYDRLKAEFLKAAPKPIRELLLRLINIIFTSNVIPADRLCRRCGAEEETVEHILDCGKDETVSVVDVLKLDDIDVSTKTELISMTYQIEGFVKQFGQ